MSARAVPGGYAILSHTWGAEEPTFDNINSTEAKGLHGYRKIEFTCRQALEHGYNYAWVDTVCIDKRSSAELSEAINSMFNWYQMAGICYAYLEDVEMEDEIDFDFELSEAVAIQFRASRWFTRSWTLQELLAPEEIIFYGSRWRYLGRKMSLILLIYEATRIEHDALARSSAILSMSVAKRMSWAARRKATREEDLAYALLGIFDVNMPMLYGEGGHKAFRRLQEEIIRGSTNGDHSILAWLTWEEDAEEGPRNPMLHPPNDESSRKQGLLAPHVYGFRHAHDIISWSSPRQEDFEISYHGLKITLLMSPPLDNAVRRPHTTETFIDPDLRYAALNCRYKGEPWTHIVLQLQRRKVLDASMKPNSGSVHMSTDLWDRVHRMDANESFLRSIAIKTVNHYKSVAVILTEQPYHWPHPTSCVHVAPADSSCKIIGSQPREAWDERHSILTLKASGGVITWPQGRRAAILLLSASNDRANGDVHKPIAIVISIDFTGNSRDAHVRPPEVGAILSNAIGDITEIADKYGTLVLPGKPQHIPVNGGSAIRVESKFINAAERMIWSLRFSLNPQNIANIDPRAITSSQQLNMNPGSQLRFDATEKALEAGPSAGRALKLFWRGY